MLRFVKALLNFHYRAMKAERAFDRLIDHLESKPLSEMTPDEKRQLQIIADIIVIEDILDLHIATNPYENLAYRLQKDWLLEEVKSLCTEEFAF